jgi:hypothetical protein
LPLYISFSFSVDKGDVIPHECKGFMWKLKKIVKIVKIDGNW